MSATYTTIKKLNIRNLHYTENCCSVCWVICLFYVISTTFAGELIELPQDTATSLHLPSRDFRISVDSAWCICSYLPFWMWLSFFVLPLYIFCICLWKDGEWMLCHFNPLISGLKGHLWIWSVWFSCLLSASCVQPVEVTGQKLEEVRRER